MADTLFIVHEDSVDFLQKMNELQKDLHSINLELKYLEEVNVWEIVDFELKYVKYVDVWEIVDPEGRLTHKEIVEKFKRIFKGKIKDCK
jgi:hypothetical protein